MWVIKPGKLLPSVGKGRVVLWGVIIAAVLASALWYTGLGLRAWEGALMALYPSAARAYSYGERHFNGRVPGAYDIKRAEHFFREAERLDSEYHYLNHELARIEFLKGNFSTALHYINKQIALEGDVTPNSYYIRGLIQGYRGMYAASAEDYEYYLTKDPVNWAAVNDYAWVLLKAGRAQSAQKAIEKALPYFPENPWLLNSYATALFEQRRYADAYVVAQQALKEVARVTEREWSHAYPGNDPKIAREGVVSFRAAVEANMHSIERALHTSAVQ